MFFQDFAVVQGVLAIHVPQNDHLLLQEQANTNSAFAASDVCGANAIKPMVTPGDPPPPDPY